MHAVLGGMFSLARDPSAAGIPVAACCRMPGFSRQAFYEGTRSRVPTGAGRRPSDQRRVRYPRRRSRVRVAVHRRRTTRALDRRRREPCPPIVLAAAGPLGVRQVVRTSSSIRAAGP
ncbi:hypothetical protein RHA1_ro02681 [Rhodococcus jostii RHA1]|uniref:Uncharacterized protein n=1 Tax=Rhodococcus jostii (strain RHA1) TaxID=101510 RepID=Q0SDA0_RHOJR|nr:hypothetical protein RHA1_ro02681 [Rhodococcus jostii RHA1]